MDQLRADVAAFERGWDCRQEKGRDRGNGSWRFDHKNLILLGVEAGTKEEALRKTSGLLQSQGYVKETFYSALLEREAGTPTGLALPACDIAIPHDAGT